MTKCCFLLVIFCLVNNAHQFPSDERDLGCPKFYYIPPKIKLNYSEALKFCQNEWMQLVSIQDEEEYLVVEKVIMKEILSGLQPIHPAKFCKGQDLNHFYWTSGYLDDGVWYWNKNEKITYTKWATGQPDDKGETEKCIEIYFPYYRARWSDQDCSDENYVICESEDIDSEN